MKKLLQTISMMMVLVLVCTCIPSVSVNAATKAKEPLQVLFIGNSKTLGHGNPAKTFEEIARANGKNVQVTICGMGGYSLHDIVTDNKHGFVNTIKNGNYDIVIMQEAVMPYLGWGYTDKQEHKMNATQSRQEYANSVKKIAKWVRAKNPNVKLYIRQVWVGEEYGTVSQIKGAGQTTKKFYIRDPRKVTKNYTCTSAEKNEAYEYTAYLAGHKDVKATVIYDGYIMGAFNNDYIEKYKIFEDDKYHQNRLGSMLVASVVYVSIYNEMPTLIPNRTYNNNVINSLDQAKAFQKIIKKKYPNMILKYK